MTAGTFDKTEFVQGRSDPKSSFSKEDKQEGMAV